MANMSLLHCIANAKLQLCLFVVSIFSVFTVYIFFFPNAKAPFPGATRGLSGEFKEVLRENVLEVKKVAKRPKILVWAQQHNRGHWTFKDVKDGYGGCDLTYDRKEFNDSDAVLFFMKTAVTRDLPPKTWRRQNQTFIWWCHESPWMVLHYYKHTLKDFNNYFNWTMTYKHDSDVLAQLAPSPYLDYLLYRLKRSDGAISRKISSEKSLSESEYKSQLQRLMSGKQKLAVWVVSDCSLTTGAGTRMSLVKQMKQNDLLPIDELGKCSGHPFPLNNTILFETLKPYKFYMAFENAYHCNDYFTEKFFYNGLVANLVPIVYGPRKDDVLKTAPPGSFIHFEDFKNISDFANYLKYLDSNDSAYQKYFDWWKSPGAHVIPRYGFNYGSDPKNWNRTLWSIHIQDDWLEHQRFGLYHLCRKLRSEEHIKTTKIIPDLNKLFYGPEPPECYKE